MFGANMFLPGF